MKLVSRCHLLAAIITLFCMAAAPIGMADDHDEPTKPRKSADEITVESMNPVGSLFTVNNEFEYSPYQGSLPLAGDQTTQVWRVTPSFPMMLDNGKTLTFRASFPINLQQPTYLVNGVEYIEWRIRQDADVIDRNGTFFDIHDHLYDISYDVAYGGVSDTGLITMLGVAGVIPSSQDGSVERDHDMIGPQGAIGKITDWGVYGVWGSHVTKFRSASDQFEDYDSNLTTIKLFFAYGLGNGWHLVSNPVIRYDWEAAAGNDLYLPLGGGVSKTFHIGRMPFVTNLEAYTYLDSPDAFGPDWMLKFSINPVISDRAWK